MTTARLTTSSKVSAASADPKGPIDQWTNSPHVSESRKDNKQACYNSQRINKPRSRKTRIGMQSGVTQLYLSNHATLKAILFQHTSEILENGGQLVKGWRVSKIDSSDHMSFLELYLISYHSQGMC